MFKQIRTTRLQRRLSSWEPFAVLHGYKNRDGPLIYHKRDGPQWYRFIGLEHNGTGPPERKIVFSFRIKEIFRLLVTSNLIFKLENIMKTKRCMKVIGLVILGMLGFQQVSYAVGTSAGVTISNQATLTYTVSGANQTPIDSTTASFVVDNRVNLLVSAVGGALTPGAPGETLLVTTFNVSNLGNEDQGYTFTASNVASGQTLFGSTDAFDVTITRIMVDTNDNNLADDTWVAGATTDLLSLAENADIDVFVEATIPVSATATQAGLVSLLAVTNDDRTTTATTDDSGSADNPAAVDVVFFEDAGSDDLAENGQHSARNGYVVETAQISINKTATAIRDLVNDGTNPKAIPGAHVQYSVVIENDDAAAADAVLTAITDVLSTDLVFDPDHIDGATGNPQNAAGRGIRVVSGTTGNCGVVGTTPRNTAINSFLTTAIDGDGAEHDDSATGGDVDIELDTVLPADLVSGHAAGELRPCENVTITFNVIVQ